MWRSHQKNAAEHRGTSRPLRDRDQVLGRGDPDHARRAVARADRQRRRRGRGPAGEPTRDPTAARRGALLPFGGYKGFGLALMMQALGLLAGSGLGAESDSGYLFVAFRPDLFGPVDTFERQVTQLIERIKATPRRR